MKNTFKCTLLAAAALAGVLASGTASAQLTFYEYPGFGGRSFTTAESVTDFGRNAFNDRASSIIVERERWEVCEDVGYAGRCRVLRQGRYASLAAMGLNDRISSVRAVGMDAPVDDTRYGPTPAPVLDHRYGNNPEPKPAYRRRDGERLFEANVTSVRAVVATPSQRCWVEKGQVTQAERGPASVTGGVVGALLGGVLGHQIGGGFGKDLATVGGAVGGAVVGANIGRDRNPQTVTGPDVRRCADVPGQARTEYWDVGYSFRGREHQVQTTTQPGPTITVNRNGEPRG